MILHYSVPVSLDLKHRLLGFHQSLHLLPDLNRLLLDVVLGQSLLQLVTLAVACATRGTLSDLLWGTLRVALKARSLAGMVDLFR